MKFAPAVAVRHAALALLASRIGAGSDLPAPGAYALRCSRKQVVDHDVVSHF